VKITAAKDAFYAERDKAEQALIVLLEKKEAAAKQAGDLKALEAVRAELEAFRKEGKLPKSVPLTMYETAMKLARTKLQNIYLASIKSYTQKDEIDQAKELQAELERITKNQNPAVKSPISVVEKEGYLPVGSVWENTEIQITLTVTENKDTKFRAMLDNKGKAKIFELNGTVKDKTFTCLAKDIRVIQGDAVPDFFGTVTSDEKGPIIKISVRMSGSEKGHYDLRLTDKK
jgi:hypothetical protein